MATKKKWNETSNGKRANLRVSLKALKFLRARAKSEERSIISVLDQLCGV